MVSTFLRLHCARCAGLVWLASGLFCSGCLAPITTRLDAVHTELQLTRQEMAEVNARLNESNRHLENIEALLKRFPLLKPASQLPDELSPGAEASDKPSEPQTGR